MKKYLLPLLLVLIVLAFFAKTIFQGLLPIPTDALVGLYHPFRDLLADQYPNGIPFKNFLITDPVRQQYPWRELAVSTMKQGELPLWNPYQFAGTPLLGNLQSAALYPLNILYWLMPFQMAWTVLVILQPLLASLFMYLYLKEMKLFKLPATFGAVIFAFSGFFIAWLEWNTVLHVILWLPLLLLALEKLRVKLSLLWSTIFIFALSSSFLAGHLQVFFYVSLVLMAYLVTILYRSKSKGKLVLLLSALCSLFAVVTSLQWIQFVKFYLNSAREIDQVLWQKEGWFIPLRHLVQFVVPDFFGNPATLNYWGVWNYGEFIGYVGIAGFIFALLAIIYRRDKKTFFFLGLFVASILFATNNVIAQLPFRMGLPLIGTSQPTRLLAIIDFSLAVLAALGLDYFLRRQLNIKKISTVLVLFLSLFIALWIYTDTGSIELAVAKRNLILPTLLFSITALLLLGSIVSRNKKIFLFTVYCLLFTVVFDLFRFGWKFTPFVASDYLFSRTKVLDYLQQQDGVFRIMAVDSRILPPNVATHYRLQDVSGYDPLYLRSYSELVSAWVRDKPDISPIGFNRILTPQNYESRIADLLNVMYVLSLDELTSPKLTKVFEEGSTKVYENIEVFPRAYLVESVVQARDKQDAINKIFDQTIDLRKQAIVYDDMEIESISLEESESVNIIHYGENEIIIELSVNYPRLLVLSDSYYPSWKVFIDEKEVKLYQVDYTLRGIVVSQGEHVVEFAVRII